MATLATTETLTQTKNTKKKVWICVIGSIVILIFRIFSYSSSSLETSGHPSPTTHLFTIYTDKWRVIEVSKEVDINIVPINGWQPKWLISKNDPSSPVEIPSTNGEQLKMYSVRRFFISLKPNQGISEATISVKEKEE